MGTALPIVIRELRLAARRRGTYWIRCCSAALIGGVFFGMLMNTHEPPSRVAQVAFLFTKILCFTYCLFAGVRFTADALSQERREGTLGLLFLTDLRGYDVVLGKMVITSLNAFFALLAALPLLALPILIGGVSAGEFWRTTLVLINTLLFSLAVGMLVSAFGVEERKVLLGTLLLLLLVTFGLPLAWRFASRISNPVWLEWVTLFPSPAHLLNVSASGLFVAVPSLFWPCMATVAWLTLVCLGVASFHLPRSFQEPTSPVPLAGRASVPLKIQARTTSFQHWVQLRFLPPYYWRLTRGRSLAKMPLLLTGIIGLVAMVSLAISPMSGRGGPPAELVYGWFGFHWLMKFLVALESARPFCEDKQCGALELLLASPLPPKQMIQAQTRRVRRLFGVPIAVMCLANLLISASVNDRVLSTMFFMGAFMLPADCLALHWCAMHFSMACATFTRAVFSALWRVLIPADIAFFVCVLAMASRSVSDHTFRSVYTVWALGAIVYTFMLVGAKRYSLRRQFRRLAAGDARGRPVLPHLPRFDPPPFPKQAMG